MQFNSYMKELKRHARAWKRLQYSLTDPVKFELFFPRFQKRPNGYAVANLIIVTNSFEAVIPDFEGGLELIRILPGAVLDTRGKLSFLTDNNNTAPLVLAYMLANQILDVKDAINSILKFSDSSSEVSTKPKCKKHRHCHCLRPLHDHINCSYNFMLHPVIVLGPYYSSESFNYHTKIIGHIEPVLAVDIHTVTQTHDGHNVTGTQESVIIETPQGPIEKTYLHLPIPEIKKTYASLQCRPLNSNYYSSASAKKYLPYILQRSTRYALLLSCPTLTIPFFDENNLLHYFVNVYLDGDIHHQIATAVYCSADPNYEFVVPEAPRKALLSHLPLFKSNHESPVCLTTDLIHANKLNHYNESFVKKPLIYMSWFGGAAKVDSLNVQPLEGRQVSICFNPDDENSAEHCLGVVFKLYTKLRSICKVKFCYYDDKGSLISGVSYKRFVLYLKTLGLIMPVDPTDYKSLASIGRLAASKDITDIKPVIVSKYDHNNVFASLGGIIVIAAGSKCSKSAFAANVAYQISIGGDFLAYKMFQFTVLYVCTEMLETDWKHRGWTEDDLDNPKYDDLHFLIFTKIIKKLGGTPIFESDQDKVDWYFSIISAKIKETHAQVVFIDCIYKMLPNVSQQIMDRLISKLEEYLAQFGIAIVLVHHLKNEKLNLRNPLHSLGGHSNLQKAIPGGMIFDKTGEKIIDPQGLQLDELVLCTVARNTPEPNRMVYVDSSHTHQLYVPPSTSTNPSTLTDIPIATKAMSDERRLMQLIELFISNVPCLEHRALSTDEMIKLIVGSGIYTKSYVKVALPKWVKKGLLIAVGKGNEGKSYYLGAKCKQHASTLHIINP